MALDATHVSITLVGGTRHEMSIAHCVGSQQQPMTDGQLDDKFRAQCEPVLGIGRSVAALDLLRRLETLENVGDCALACAGAGES
jgi:hypothetical protein